MDELGKKLAELWGNLFQVSPVFAILLLAFAFRWIVWPLFAGSSTPAKPADESESGEPSNSPISVAASPTIAPEQKVAPTQTVATSLGSELSTFRVAMGQVLAGVVNGIVFAGGGSLLLGIAISFSTNVKPGAEARGATMALWAFIGAYFSGALGALLSAIIKSPRPQPAGWSLSAIPGIGICLAVIGYHVLHAMNLFDHTNGIGGTVFCVAMGLFLGVFLFYWLNRNLPGLFPLLPKTNRPSQAEEHARTESEGGTNLHQ